MDKIETEEQYQEALKEVEELWGSILDTPEGKKLDELVNEIVKYEEIKFYIPFA